MTKSLRIWEQIVGSTDQCLSRVWLDSGSTSNLGPKYVTRGSYWAVNYTRAFGGWFAYGPPNNIFLFCSSGVQTEHCSVLTLPNKFCKDDLFLVKELQAVALVALVLHELLTARTVILSFSFVRNLPAAILRATCNCNGSIDRSYIIRPIQFHYRSAAATYAEKEYHSIRLAVAGGWWLVLICCERIILVVDWC